MAGSVNKVILVGNLGRDPEVRNTQGGQKVVELRVATSESWNDRQTNERQERTEWHRVVIWNERLGEVAERFLRKGRKVYLEGSLQTRKYTDKDGQERYVTEVVLQRFRGELVLLDSRAEGGGAEAGEYERAAPAGGPSRGGHGGERERGSRQGWDRPAKGGSDLDDEIPF
jgi:single-strand DNA-binding protein